jgi:hypothetical protein
MTRTKFEALEMPLHLLKQKETTVFNNALLMPDGKFSDPFIIEEAPYRTLIRKTSAVIYVFLSED